ncbi:MAG: acetylglutamate kinase [Porcipelethomonas sp.]
MYSRCNCNQTKIRNEMRKLWSQHVYWTRMFIISTVEKLNDLSFVTDRLLENPSDFSMALKMFYDAKTADRFGKLLTDHLKTGGDLVSALNMRKTEKADALRDQWYMNADEISCFLSSVNPNWCEKNWKDMMHRHLSMTEKEAGFRISKNYPKDIDTFNAIEKEALEMADNMPSGIIRQFCCK